MYFVSFENFQTISLNKNKFFNYMRLKGYLDEFRRDYYLNYYLACE